MPGLGRLTLWGRRLGFVDRTYSARLWVSLTQGPSLQSSSPRSSVKMAGAFSLLASSTVLDANFALAGVCTCVVPNSNEFVEVAVKNR